MLDGEDGWYNTVSDRLAMQRFPQESHACSAITLKCWIRQYGSAQDVIREIETIEEHFATDGAGEVNGKAFIYMIQV